MKHAVTSDAFKWACRAWYRKLDVNGDHVIDRGEVEPLLDHLHMYTLQRSGFPDLEVRDTHQEYEEIFDTYNDHVMQEDEFYFYVKFQIIVLLRDQPLVHSRP